MYQVHQLRSRHTEEEHKQGAYSWFKWEVIRITRRKREAIDAVNANPTRAVATIAHSSEKVADNGKPPIIDRSI